MKNNTFIAILLLLPAFVFAQYEFKPIVDTSAIHCAHVENPIDPMPNPHYNYTKKIQGLYHIVEQMPKPKISADEMATLLKNEVGLNADEKKLKGTMYFQCIVNCKGEAGDFQINHCPENFITICGQTFGVVKKQLNSWQPGMQRGKNADVLVKIKVTINKGDFSIVAPLF